ncbi:MAG TPA: hypothetical protein VJB60_03315 [Candidatus Peribacterales bacterium]|nr:hypothetical protein [Candidatus Peribacterales bacterium]
MNFLRNGPEPSTLDSRSTRNGCWFRASRFWCGALIALVGTGLLFAYELNMLSAIGLEGPPRSMTHEWETILAIIIALLFSMNVGLIAWHRKQGTCPVGIRRAAGAAGILGALALLCPVCLALPIGIASVAAVLMLLAPFVALIQGIAIVLLVAGLWLLIPRARIGTMGR